MNENVEYHRNMGERVKRERPPQAMQLNDQERETLKKEIMEEIQTMKKLRETTAQVCTSEVDCRVFEDCRAPEIDKEREACDKGNGNMCCYRKRGNNSGRDRRARPA